MRHKLGSHRRVSHRWVKSAAVIAAVALSASAAIGGVAAAKSSSRWHQQPTGLCTAGIAGAKTLALTSGCAEYLYVGSNSGGAPITTPSWTEDLAVTAKYSGFESVSIGHSTSDTGSYTTTSGNYGIAGVGLPASATLVETAQTSEVGPGYPGGGTKFEEGPSLSLSFTIPSADKYAVILVGGEGTGDLWYWTPYGKWGLQTVLNETYDQGGTQVLASDGAFSVVNNHPGQEVNVAFGSESTLNNSGESLGAVVYAFN